MPMYRLLPNYTFIDKNRRGVKERVISSDDPMFSKQLWKFENDPVGEGEEFQTSIMTSEELKGLDRDALLKLWEDLGGDAPNEDVTSSALREAIENFYAEPDNA